MKTATLRELRYDFARIAGWLREGREVRITRRGKPVFRVVPEPPAGKARSRPENGFRPTTRPDYRARLKRIWGDRVFTAAEIEEARAIETGEP